VFRKTAMATPAERILATADKLFYTQGIRAVGVDTIAAEAGVSKRTLYNHYPSKDALIAAYLMLRFRPLPPSDAPAASRSSATSIASSGFSARPGSAAARSSTRSPKWAIRSTPRAGLRSSSRSSASSGSARCWCAPA
jgi:hypothetical protein